MFDGFATQLTVWVIAFLLSAFTENFLVRHAGILPRTGRLVASAVAAFEHEHRDGCRDDYAGADVAANFKMTS
jgi:hypothetical protein